MVEVAEPLKSAGEVLPPPGLDDAAPELAEAAQVAAPPGLGGLSRAQTEAAAEQVGQLCGAYAAGAALCQGLGGMTLTTAMPCGSWKRWFPPGFSDEEQWCQWAEGEPAIVRVGKLGDAFELEDPVYVDVTSEELEEASSEAEQKLLAMDPAALATENLQPAWPYWPELAGYPMAFDAQAYVSGAFGQPWYPPVADMDWRWGERPPPAVRAARLGSRAGRARTDSDLPQPRVAPNAGETIEAAPGGRARTMSADGIPQPGPAGQAAPGAPGGEPDAAAPRTTVMLRNLPNNYTRSMLLSLLDSEGFAGQYDFVYLPMDFKTHASLGYAFVNLVSQEQAAAFWKVFEGFGKWVVASQKVCSVSWSCPYQGLSAHIERYRNSPVMHEDVPDDYKPMVFASAVRSAFPAPTKKLKAPRMRLCRDDGVQPAAREAEE